MISRAGRRDARRTPGPTAGAVAAAIAVVVAVLLGLAAVVAGATACGGARETGRETPPARSAVPQDPGAIAYRLMAELSRQHPRRIAGTEAERKAAGFIAAHFEEYGYEPRVEAVEGWTKAGAPVASANVIAVKAGESDRRIVVGAHYDSVDIGEGALDNAAGVALLLELALRLRGRPTPFTIEFVTFGAEEAGWWGSRDYYARTVAGTRGEVVCMVNLDVPTGGDKLYGHSEAGPAGWPRQHALDLARDLGIPLRAQPGLNPEYPRGTAGDWSDQRWFRQGGIPYLWIESTNWEIGEHDGFTSTATAGKIWHTAADTVAFAEDEFPGRLRRQTSQVVRVLERFLAEPLPAAADSLPPSAAPTPAMPTR